MKEYTTIIVSLLILGCGSPGNRNDAMAARDTQPQVSSSSQHIDKGRCDLAIVSRTDSRINLLRDEDVYEFLYTFSDDCETNLEYSEYSDEVLFKLLVNNTMLLSDALGKDSLNKEVIFEALTSPVNDDFSKSDILEALKKLDIPDSTRSRIVNGIQNSM